MQTGRERGEYQYPYARKPSDVGCSETPEPRPGPQHEQHDQPQIRSRVKASDRPALQFRGAVTLPVDAR